MLFLSLTLSNARSRIHWRLKSRETDNIFYISYTRWL